MDKLKQLEIKKLIRELDYVESDFEYKSEIIVENDSKFMRDVSSFLEKNPELKELFDKKISDKIDSIIKNQSNENTDIVKVEDEKDNTPNEETTQQTEGEGEPLSDKNQEEEVQNSEDIEDVKSSKLKKLYREIVKLTHPDRVKDKKLNEVYIKATGMYDKNDLAGIYSICNELKIDYEIDEDDAENINIKIRTLKDRIGFIESTITWKWHYSKTPQEKEQLVFLYIRMSLQK
jgi:hypothetical protein